MHPAPSVIIFTTLSGLGFGLLTYLGLGLPDVTGLTALVFFVLAYGMAVGGLLASTFHLGHPERAMKAFSQWRSSWLSREGCCAVGALLIMGLFAFGAVFLGAQWRFLGLIGAALSLMTVFTTSMIYAQLKSIPRWNSAWTCAMFLSFSLAGGALMAGQVGVAKPLLLIAAIIQLLTWYVGDRAFGEAGSTVGSATGLGERGSVRAFEPPHTGSNYLLREFVHEVGRKHALKLRVIGFGLAFALPLLLLLAQPESTGLKHMMAAIAVLSHLAGVACSRWLFFAEAEHVVGLYYGKR
ncbi:DMSO reductase anchor subunit [Epibacterium ulvae]|uniref:DMSO reductase anchor subunit n=1 Tax=Epibacterium ulvae TaxID=1156985 RepID=A0A1G5R630_9RHOB|nr:DmsC/YnfH family molybdoenzyme membrane anchor subunit [Epibacterium ulvae]SCZ69535.1 DMSO reductase anchor subunit [Epibacterium ulvae]